MKKLLALAPLLIVVASCGAPANKNDVAPNTNHAAESKPTETKSTPAISEADLSGREKQVWEAVAKKDYDAFAAMFDSDYLEVNNIGTFDKAATLAATKKVTLSDVSFSDWKMLPIDKAAVLISYTASFKGTYEGKPFPATSVRASSAWVNRDGKWLSIYHQETDVASPPPAPTTNTAPAAKNGASPAVKTTDQTTGPDPVANEKMVWEALKEKDYDAFAAFLAPEAIEVEATGVYDKAGSLKGVSTFDASKTSLSEWKTVKIGESAALVTCVVTTPGGKPAVKHTSTIWVNRGGKWLAIYHHGTPVESQAAPVKPAGLK
jgi:hypothetical protein